MSELNKNDLTFVRLSNGDMIAGKFVEDKDGAVTLDKAHLIMLAQDQQGNPSVSFYNYNPFGTSDQLTFKDKDVLYYDALAAEIADHYKQITSPVIQPKEAGIIL